MLWGYPLRGLLDGRTETVQVVHIVIVVPIVIETQSIRSPVLRPIQVTRIIHVDRRLAEILRPYPFGQGRGIRVTSHAEIDARLEMVSAKPGPHVCRFTFIIPAMATEAANRRDIIRAVRHIEVRIPLIAVEMACIADTVQHLVAVDVVLAVRPCVIGFY